MEERNIEGQSLLGDLELEDLEKSNQSETSRVAATRNMRSRLRVQPSKLWSSFLYFFVPTFLKPWCQPNTPKEVGKPLSATAFLDGIRGLAALLVVFYHLLYTSHNVLAPYGIPDEDGRENRDFLKWPFVRSLINGNAMVGVFFVVSGYALSYKPVKLMRSGRLEELVITLSSSVIRRGVRLFLPGIASSFLVVLLVRVRLYEWTLDIAKDSSLGLVEHRENHQVRYETLYKQLLVWFQMVWDWINPWVFETIGFQARIAVDGHLWTIPVEFRSSLVLYLTHLGISRLRHNVRLFVIVLLIIWVTLKDRWEMLLFYAGLLLAELDLRRQAAAKIESVPSRSGRAMSKIYIGAFVSGLYLCGQPHGNLRHVYGWALLDSWIPNFLLRRNKNRFWCNWGALLMVWATSCSPSLQRIFTNKPAQYLGKLSFSLYLVHGCIIHTLGYALMDVLWRNFGNEGMAKELGFCISSVVVIVVAIWVADMFMRAVDIPSVKLAKWLEEVSIRQV